MLHAISFRATDTLALGLSHENLILDGNYVAFPDPTSQPLVYRIHVADADWVPGEMVATGVIRLEEDGRVSIS